MRRPARPDRSLLLAAERVHALTDTLELLRTGELQIVGRLTDASNATFLARLTQRDGERARDTDDEPDGSVRGPLCVYKPVGGERPLDDFPRHTLARREVAAFLLSQASRWNIVPPTILRDEGPFGAGMVQQWIDVAPDADPLAMVVDSDPRLRRVAIFDVLANNADRKASHLLPVESGHVYGVDHGICFAAEPKLRTVLWAWRGQPLSADELDVVRAVCAQLGGRLGNELGALLTEREVEAAERRAVRLLAEGVFPQPDPFRPAVPWPPY